MSNRHVRKLLGDTVLPPPDDSDDEIVTLKTRADFQYAGLEVESGSEPERSQPSSEEEIEVTVIKNRNKKKKKKKKQGAGARAGPTPCGSKYKDPTACDEVDRVVAEVNALLGTPRPGPRAAKQAPPAPDASRIMDVQLKMLNYNYEVKRVFGAEALGEKESKRRDRTADLMRILKKPMIVPVNDYMETFGRIGLSMSMHTGADGRMHFMVDHSPEYQRVHREYRRAFTAAGDNDLDRFLPQVQRSHVELMVEYVDQWFKEEQYNLAKETLEHAIAYYQFIAHPQFKLNDRNARFEYKYLENRPFFVVILKHLYLLTNKACHRTALELAKMLINLDPRDPLAVILVIDIIALRAREHAWLVEAIDHWKEARHAGLLYNIQYSEALATFHVALKAGDEAGKARAAQLLELAIVNFPLVAARMMMRCGSVARQVLQHRLFTEYGAVHSVTVVLATLCELYAELIWTRWNEPDVQPWFVGTCRRAAERFDADVTMRTRVSVARNTAMFVYRSYPPDVHRHLCVLRPMSELVAGGKVPYLPTRWACDPQPPASCIDRYGYTRYADARPIAADPPALYQFLHSLMPMYNPNREDEPHEPNAP